MKLSKGVLEKSHSIEEEPIGFDVINDPAVMPTICRASLADTCGFRLGASSDASVFPTRYSLMFGARASSLFQLSQHAAVRVPIFKLSDDDGDDDDDDGDGDGDGDDGDDGDDDDDGDGDDGDDDDDDDDDDGDDDDDDDDD